MICQVCAAAGNELTRVFSEGAGEISEDVLEHILEMHAACPDTNCPCQHRVRLREGIAVA